ncbi:MAG: phosphate uptake regulator PhoU, partial [Nitrosopumilaceae archaeon]|nr:phosphate uptake regulator PhoU [Nitrosopumilaceae archaeon]
MPKFIRRLQRIGSSTLVSLPKDWVDSNQLAKNAEVELETGQNSITIIANKESRPSKEITISYPLPHEENIVADLTGAYLLGYDVINIKGKTSIPIGDREKIRNSMRRLVGMEIVEEDSTTINMQFLLDATTLNPQKILKRISNIVLGMYNDTISGLVEDDKTNLQTIANRDDEVNRQYFLLVRLIRSTMVDQRLASSFNLENIDILDYRIAANLLESAGDTIVELANSIIESSIPKSYLKKMYDVTKNFELMESKTIDAFINNDRKLAIEAITLH